MVWILIYIIRGSNIVIHWRLVVNLIVLSRSNLINWLVLSNQHRDLTRFSDYDLLEFYDGIIIIVLYQDSSTNINMIFSTFILKNIVKEDIKIGMNASIKKSMKLFRRRLQNQPYSQHYIIKRILFFSYLFFIIIYLIDMAFILYQFLSFTFSYI